MLVVRDGFDFPDSQGWEEHGGDQEGEEHGRRSGAGSIWCVYCVGSNFNLWCICVKVQWKLLYPRLLCADR